LKNFKAFLNAGTVLPFIIGCIGIAPHLWFSLKVDRWAYLINSYDEGYYGFSALLDPKINAERIVSNTILQLLNIIFQSCSKTFLFCDFIFPAIICAVSYQIFFLLLKNTESAALATICFIFSPELFCNRSVFLADKINIGKYIGNIIQGIPGFPDQLLINNNQTGTFWIFRTPEPQISQVILFAALLFSIKKWLSQNNLENHFILFPMLLFFVLPFCYSFVVLPFLPFIIAGYAIFFPTTFYKKPELWVLAFGGFLRILATVLTPNAAAGFTFHCRTPALTISCILSVIALAICSMHSSSDKKLKVLGIVGCLIPLIITNQQIISGKMIMLNNFENFALPQIVLISFVLIFKSKKV